MFQRQRLQSWTGPKSFGKKPGEPEQTILRLPPTLPETTAPFPSSDPEMDDLKDWSPIDTGDRNARRGALATASTPGRNSLTSLTALAKAVFGQTASFMQGGCKARAKRELCRASRSELTPPASRIATPWKKSRSAQSRAWRLGCSQSPQPFTRYGNGLPAKNAARLAITQSCIATWASKVWPPICGVSTTLGNSLSASGA